MRLIVSLVSVFVVTACAHTRIAARDIPSEANRLAAINRTPITYHVDCALDDIVGHQYLLIALPFGRISLEAPATHIEHALYQELALAGYDPIHTTATNAALQIRSSLKGMRSRAGISSRIISGCAAR